MLIVATLPGAIESRAAQRAFGPGRCGPIDPVYVRGATETGGLIFPMAPSEVAQMGTFIAESSRSDSAMILWAGGTAADAEGGFVVPVDASVKRLTLSIMFDGTGGSAEIVRPDAGVVRAGALPGDITLNCGRILSVDAPEAGNWRVAPTPSSRFWLKALARSDRDLLTAEFVRRGGRPSHEGLFPIDGSPIAGRPAMLRVTLSEPEERVPVFELFSAQGRAIQRVTLDRVADDEFVGEIELPSSPFRVGVSGTNADGIRYQRMVGRMYRAESVEVVSPVLGEVKAGADTPIEFIVRNYGGRVRYRVTSTVGGKVLSGIEPPVLDFAANGEQRVTVLLPTQTIAAAGTSLELHVIAESEDQNRPSWNSAFLRLGIVKR